jgi:hypothetical protein
MIEEQEVKTIEVNCKCPKCEEGYLMATGRVLLTYPLQYEHECTHCVHKDKFIDKTYPYIKNS